MPNSKPQVMWMIKDDAGDLWPEYFGDTRQQAIGRLMRHNLGENGITGWESFYAVGYRAVKVEVRETKKGK